MPLWSVAGGLSALFDVSEPEWRRELDSNMQWHQSHPSVWAGEGRPWQWLMAAILYRSRGEEPLLVLGVMVKSIRGDLARGLLFRGLSMKLIFLFKQWRCSLRPNTPLCNTLPTYSYHETHFLLCQSFSQMFKLNTTKRTSAVSGDVCVRCSLGLGWGAAGRL